MTEVLDNQDGAQFVSSRVKASETGGPDAGPAERGRSTPSPEGLETYEGGDGHRHSYDDLYN